MMDPAPRPEGTHSLRAVEADPRRWTIIRVDVDALPAPHEKMGDAPTFFWVEVLRDAQVIGVIHCWSPDGTLPHATAEDLRMRFGTVVPAPRPEVDDGELPFISVVVPTVHRNSELLRRTVRALQASDYPRFEIVVVDNRPSDLEYPMPIFEDTHGLKIVAESTPGISAARNSGIASSLGSIVAFTDDDAMVDPDWLRAIGETFAAHPEVDGVGGLVLPSELETDAQLWFEEFFGGFNDSYTESILSIDMDTTVSPLFPYSPSTFGAGCNLAFRKDTLGRIGGFATVLGTGTPAKGGEDLAACIETVLRGGCYAYVPRAVVRHTHRRTREEFLSQVYGYGVGLSAMLTYFIIEDPRRIKEIARRLPAGLKRLRTSRGERLDLESSTLPRRATLMQIAGMLWGPVALVRSGGLRVRRRA